MDKGYLFDSSVVLPVRNSVEGREPMIWPYTMDFPNGFECYTEPCPDGNFPDFWQIPVQPLLDLSRRQCIYLDGCPSPPRSSDEVNKSASTDTFQKFQNISINYSRLYQVTPSWSRFFNILQVFTILMNNFNHSYSNNRAPLMVNFLNYKKWFDESEDWAIDGINRYCLTTFNCEIILYTLMQIIDDIFNILAKVFHLEICRMIGSFVT